MDNRSAAGSYSDLRTIIIAAGYSPTRSSVENGMKVSSTYPDVFKGQSYEENPLAPNGHFVMMFGKERKSVTVDIHSDGKNSSGLISFQEPDFTGPDAKTSSETVKDITVMIDKLCEEAKLKVEFNYDYLSDRSKWIR